MANYKITQLTDIDPMQCPCGTTRRAFVAEDNPTATIHLVNISNNSRTHYHKKITEIYLILEGQGNIELDGKAFPVKPMTSILIKPLCRHRATGNLKVTVTAIPAFNPKDEWFDEDPQ